MSVINKHAIKSTFIYFIGNVLSKAIVFFMLPLYTSRIPADEMGYYDTDTTVITFFSSVLFLDIGSTILRYTLAGKSEQDKKAAMSNGLLIFVISSALYCFILGIGSFFLNVEYYGWIMLYGILYSINTVIGECTRAVEHNTDYVVAGIIQTIVQVAINLVLILIFAFDYSSLLIAFCIAAMASTLYMIIRTSLFKRVNYHLINKVLLRDIWRFTLPLCVNSIAFWLLSASGRVILRYMDGPEQVGYLSIAGKFTQLIYLVSSCIQLTWQEIAYSHDNAEKNTGIFYSKAFALYYEVMIMGVVLIIPVIKIGLTVFPDFIDSSYSESINLIPEALLGTGLAIVSLFLGTIFSSIKKTRIIFVSTLAGAMSGVLSNILFILGGLGAASVNYSIILGYVVTIAVRIIILKINLDFHVKIMDIMVPLALFVCVSTGYTKFTLTGNIFVLLVVAIMFILFFRNEVSGAIERHFRKNK